ncbi:MAG: FKBP-type peptidyl-prolyl cis-trans isomerase [Bacteroidota bacterium]
MAALFGACKSDKQYDPDDTPVQETDIEYSVDTTKEKGHKAPKNASFYKTLKNGIRMHVYDYNPKMPYPDIGDIVQLHMDYYHKDSLLFSSREVPGDFKMQINKPKYPGSVYYGLLQLHKNDSAELIVEATGFFKYTKDLVKLPEFIEMSDSLRFFVRIVDVIRQSEFQAMENEKLEDARRKEDSDIRKYMLEHELDAEEIGDRIYRIIHTKGKGQEIQPDSKVSIHYIGLFLNETPFSDTKKDGKPFTFDMSKSQVIPGLEKGLTGVREGSRLTLIIPFDEAYGPHQEGPIPPYSTLVFNIEVLDVK